jgi:acetylornithine deacetylase
VLSSHENALLSQISLDTIVSDTEALIAAKSENPGGVEEGAVRVLAAMCERIGADVTLDEVHPHRPNLHATIGPNDAPTIVFLGHSDVVPAGDGWTGDPFTPRQDNGMIIGRGSTDMKGGLAAVVAAMDAIAKNNVPVRLELVCTVDEEDQALGIEKALERLNGRSLVACIVAEPTNLDIVIGCRGATNFQLDIVGKSAHAGRPEDGASSIWAASTLIATIQKLHQQAQAGTPDSLLGAPSWNVGTISGGTGTSMVAQSTTITVDRRMMPGENPEDILSELLTEIDGELTSSGIANAPLLSVSGNIFLDMPGFLTPADSPLPRLAHDAMADLGKDSPLTGWTAACEGGFVARATNAPTIILGPGDINSQAHQPDEAVAIEDLLSAARAYTLIVTRLATTE